MKKIFFLQIFALVVCVQLVYSQAGNTGLAFLKIGQGSRSLGMGEAFSTVASEPYSMNYNPAALTLSSNSQFVFSHRQWIQDTKSEFLGASSSLGDVAFAFGIHSVSVSDIELRSKPGPSDGTFDSKNASIGVASALAITPELSLGVTANYLFEKILVDEASGFGLNVGALYQTPWQVRLGFAVDHIGSMNKLNTTETTLPTTMRFGGSYETPMDALHGELIAAAEVVSVKNEGTAHLHIGGEFEYQNMFAIRAGFQTGYESKNFTTGIGFKYSLFKFDYAFIPTKLDLGSSHTFTLGVEF